jgi:hypothetical protein
MDVDRSNLAGLEQDVSPEEVLQGQILVARERCRSPFRVEVCRLHLWHVGDPQRAKVRVEELHGDGTFFPPASQCVIDEADVGGQVRGNRSEVRLHQKPLKILL